MTKEENYKYIFDLVLHESKFAWNTGNLFLLADTILAGSISLSFKNGVLEYPWFLVAVSTLGLLISILWHLSLIRIQRRQDYWFARAREFEKDKENKLPSIFSGDAHRLANGGVVEADGEKFDLKIKGILHLRSHTALSVVVKLFLIFYIFVIAMGINRFRP